MTTLTKRYVCTKCNQVLSEAEAEIHRYAWLDHKVVLEGEEVDIEGVWMEP